MVTSPKPLKENILEGIMGLVQKCREGLRWAQTKLWIEKGIREKVAILKR